MLRRREEECGSEVSRDTECEQWDDRTADSCIVRSLGGDDTIHDTGSELLRVL